MTLSAPSPLPPIVSLLGHSGAGKTATAVALVSRWRARGLRVGYVKHASHGFQMDRAGKDTDRVLRAGALAVAVTGPDGLAFLEPRPEPDPRAIVRRLLPDADVVVAEGFRGAALPVVAIAGPDGHAPVLAEVRGPLLAVVAPVGAPARVEAAARGAPAFAPHETDALARHIETALDVRSVTEPPALG